jgi:hypothetical protein
MTDKRSTSIAELTPKAEDVGKDILNADFLRYHAPDPNNAEDSLMDCSMPSCHRMTTTAKQPLQIKNSVG